MRLTQPLRKPGMRLVKRRQPRIEHGISADPFAAIARARREVPQHTAASAEKPDAARQD